MPVEVHGPDGKVYHFPDGTDKTAAIAYFKKKGIGGVQATNETTEPTPGYFKEAISGVGRAASSLLAIPKQLLTPHETFGATREEEVKMGPTGRLLYNIPADILESSMAAEGARQAAKRQGEGKAGQVLAYLENSMVAPLVKKAEQAGPGRVKFTPQTVGAVTEGVGLVELPRAASAVGIKAGELLKTLKKKARGEIASLAGAGPERTTEPMVEEFKVKSAEAKKAQAEENVKAETENVERKQEYHEKLSKSFDEAKKEQLEQEQSRNRIQERNEAAQAQQGKRTELAQSLKQGSRQFGQGVKELARRVKEQLIDPQYAEIRKATAKDPGEPLAEIAQDARNAEKLITGSSENIKQFRELLRKAPETEGVQTSAGFTVPGEPLYDQLVREGAIDTGGNLPYSDIQGYATELGDKLRRGGLPSDVYMAIKSLKEKLDARKQVIADRNGVGGNLTKADADYTHYQDTFYDKPSAIAATLDRVGKLDPDYYAEPVITGKAALRGISRLRIYSKEFPEAGRLADQAESLRKQHTDFSELPKKATLKPVPEAEIPKKEVPKLATKVAKQIEQPKPPTIEDVKERKIGELKKESREIGRLNRWDASLIAASAIGPFFGRWETLLIDPAYLVGRKSLGKILDRPAVQKWLAEPTPADLRILNSLPEEVKTDIRSNLTEFATTLKNPRLAPETKSFLGQRNVERIASLTGGIAGSEKKRKSPGQQIRDLHAITSSNPNMPTGSPE